jgi:hypothetical protein
MRLGFTFPVSLTLKIVAQRYQILLFEPFIVNQLGDVELRSNNFQQD